MERIYQLLNKKFLTEDEIAEIEEDSAVEYEFCGMSGLYPAYKWEVVTINGEEYDIYFK